LANARPYEVSIEVSEEVLRRYGLTLDDVASAVRRSSLDLPGGSIRAESGEILLRTKGQAYLGEEFEKLALISRIDGTIIRLGDVATVVDGFEETDQRARFDGNPAVLIQVFRVGGQSALEVAESVKKYIVEAQSRVPEGITLTTWQDDSRVLRSRLDLLLRNGRAGFVLVVLILALFLRLKLSFWASLGIPISFLGTLLLMPALDVSINLISLFAFIVVLGIVVDDAIVVGEHIFAHYERGKSRLEAAVAGASGMAVPVIFAVLTTIAAFAPLLAVPGAMGKIFKVIPLIVIPTLLFSLFECLFILPAHLSHLEQKKVEKRVRGISALWKGFRGFFDGALKFFISRIYSPVLSLALSFRYATMAVGVATLLITVGVVGSGRIKFEFFPEVEADYVIARLTMPLGTPVEVTIQAVTRIERSLNQLREEIDGQSEGSESVFRHVLTSIGEQPSLARGRGHRSASGSDSGGYLAEVNVELAPSEERSLSSTQLAERWRELTGQIPDVVELEFTSSLFSAGDDIDVQLTGADVSKLRQAANELKEELKIYPGVYDISDSFRAGKKEVKLKIKPEAEILNLSQMNLARQVRQAFYGEEAQRIQRGRDDVRIMVRYPRKERSSLGYLENMRIRAPGGMEVPFSTVAEAETGRGYSAIDRVDRRRSINVTAKVDSSKANANEVIAELERVNLSELLRRFPEIGYTLEGEQREQQETLDALGQGFTLALLAIFALMAVPLRSYLQPIIIMTAIPFGLVGAVWGHMILGYNLTILSGFGMVALSGVVVNDSLIMVDYINKHRQPGRGVFEAVRESGKARFRPILLTSLTTFGGLTPLLLEKSLQAQFLIPMAISLAFGVVFATFITLLMVPAEYLILEDFKRIFHWVTGRKAESEVRPELASEVRSELRRREPAA
jgi:multidrug efflux pump subunit AcrB